MVWHGTCSVTVMSRLGSITALASALFAMLFAAPAAASDWGIVLNGKAVHVDSSYDWNERNWGLGFEREFHSEARWVGLALGSGFVDSQDSMSYLGGGGLKRRFRPPGRRIYFDVGVVGFMMTRTNIDKSRPFPGFLPTFTVGSPQIALNIAYLPGAAADAVAGVRNLDPGIDSIWFLQLRLSPQLFSPRRRTR